MDIKIDGALKVLNGFQKKLSLNPLISSEKYERLELIINDITLAFVENNEPLLCEESLVHEFKTSLRIPYPDIPEFERMENRKKVYKLRTKEFESEKQIHNFLEEIIMKTVASFLNTKGGKLVIGINEVKNEKKVVGIDREGFKSHDDYLRHISGLFNNAFKSVITSQYLNSTIVKIQNIPCCLVECQKYPEEEPIFFKNKVYVRTGPRIDEIVGAEIIDFMKGRQSNKTSFSSMA